MAEERALPGTPSTAVPGSGAPRPATPQALAEARAIRAAGIAVVVAGLLGFLWLLGTRHPISGLDSVGSRGAVLAALTGAVAFAAPYLEQLRGKRAQLPLAKLVLDGVALALAHGGLAYLGCLMIAELFQQSFVGLDVDAVAGALMIGIANAVVAYLATLSGSAVTGRSLASLVATMLLVGTFMSMLTASDPNWWNLHFSQLGNALDRSAWRFNGTLIVSGLVVTTLANYIGRDLEAGLRARGAAGSRLPSLVAWLFAVIGVCLAVVGLVPDAVNKAIHVGAASGMVVVFATTVILLVVRLPGLDLSFRGLSVGVLLGIVVSVLLWIPFDYYNLTGVEFAAAGLIFVWLVLFVRTLDSYRQG